MARTEARLKCDIWDDEDFRSLTWEAQWLYEALLTQKDLSLCGVLTYTPKRFAKLAPNATASAVKKALDLLRQKRYVVLDDDTDEVLVRTLVKGDGVLSNHNSIIGMSKAYEAIHSSTIRKVIVQEVIKGVAKGVAVGGSVGATPTEWVQGLPDHIRKRLGQPFAKALALAGASAPPRPPVPPASCLLPPASPSVQDSSSNHQSVGAPVGETEEEEFQNRETQAVALVAERQLQVRLAKTELGPVGDRAGWLKSARAKVWVDHGNELLTMAEQGMNAKAMADRILPPLPRPYPAVGEVSEPNWDEVTDEHGRLAVVPRRVG